MNNPKTKNKMNKINNIKLKNAVKKIEQDTNKNVEIIDVKKFPIGKVFENPKFKQKKIEEYFISIKKK